MSSISNMRPRRYTSERIAMDRAMYSDSMTDKHITSPGHETPLASGVSTNVSVDVDTGQHDSEADVDA
eukprot:scaffold29064_cov99-Amphora_coffeaeformis.AAC.1